MSNILNTLNRNQRIAVEHIDGPCLVLAGPGSGKTRVIAHRIYNMIKNHDIPPTRILAISFTKASSDDIKKKTLDFARDDRVKKVNFGTFHSSFFRILRKYSGINLEDIISENDRYKLMKIVLRQLKISNISDDDIAAILSDISYVKNEMIEPILYNCESFESEVFSQIFDLYERGKNSVNKIDFDDMLIMTYKLLLENEDILEIVRSVYKYILIDEFQDVNKVQFEVIKLIAKPLNNVFVVGDEDQSIYGFRGARPDFMLNFSKYFDAAKTVILEKNYRSDKNIVELSQRLIKNNKNRYEKRVFPYRTTKGNICYIYPKDIEDEANIIAEGIKNAVEKEENEYSDFAVIYRTNRQSRALVDSFMNNRIPFVLKDSAKSIFDHWASMDMIAYMRIAMNIATNEEWARVINKPFRYISKIAVDKAVKSVDFFEALLNNPDIKEFQKRDLRDVYEDLLYIRTLAPEYAISYIRTTLDYDRYILEYCHERKIKAKGIVDILDELESSSKSFKSSFDFFKHIDEVREELKKKNIQQKKSSLDDLLDEGVVLTTMHSSKGLEFKNVFIAGVIDGIVPYINSEDENIDENHEEEERRLFYVGITRAKDNLTISIPAKKYNKKAEKSRFIKGIENEF
ncbi:ATP-dependent helicase [Peptostreptococcus sp. D1]|uniref:ATP-dependent helicase n=1 Tax=Peptostreptococcus sp. D1 TaxID=72304 RepID=UPI0008DEE075|nr:ATP-dependent helicase [Peptostreptococcus sp. D1]SFE20844.1 DNA helicase-2 / ATP-dependent DNA helicase PcrA [Peptostreptococcus sp. D1]